MRSEDRSGDATQGQAATTRPVRDVLGETHVDTVILFEGGNDLAAASKIIDAYVNIADQLYAQDIRVLIGTLTSSFDSVVYGAGYTTNAGTRDTVNTWIRTQHVFEGVIDFVAAAAGPADPELWNPIYDSGDQGHPTSLA